MIRYTLADGRLRSTHVDVSSWVPIDARYGMSLAEMIDLAEATDALQRVAHADDAEEIRECSRSDCWVAHLNDALRALQKDT